MTETKTVDDSVSIISNSMDIDASDEESVLDAEMCALDECNLKKTDIISYERTYEKYRSKSKVSKPYITKYEKAKILGIRAQQLATGSKPMVPIHDKINIKEIARAEYSEKKIPLIIRRYLPNGDFEDWRLSDFLNVC